jgi:predicted phosphodiesterase
VSFHGVSSGLRASASRRCARVSQLEIVDPPQDCPYDAVLILAACRQRRQMAGPGESYTGRPVTALLEHRGQVVKLRTEYQLPPSQARRFVAQAVARERLLGVHHPHKTWFLWTPSAHQLERVIIGNITPHLLALNQSQALAAAHTPEAVVDLVAEMLERYLDMASRHELSLDLCLSNFGLDENGALHYLDDDLYPGSNFTVLSDALATLVRGQAWLTPPLAARLGKALRHSLQRHVVDPHWITVIAESLRGVFVAEAQRASLKALMEGLCGGPGFSYEPRQTSSVIALLADIHGNAPALETALEYLQRRGIATALVLGDLVGYGPHPQQCVAMVRDQAAWSVIRGNHDHLVAKGLAVTGVSSLAHWTLKWTMANLDEESHAWLAQLPPYLQTESWLAVHGSPKDKTFFNGYVYQMSYVENLDALAARKLPLCFHGHTHIPKVYRRDAAGDSACSDTSQDLRQARQALVCPGSVGQPRAGVPGVELAVMDLEQGALELLRLPYDMERTIKDMGKRHFPPDLGERLRRGQ